MISKADKRVFAQTYTTSQGFNPHRSSYSFKPAKSSSINSSMSTIRQPFFLETVSSEFEVKKESESPADHEYTFQNMSVSKNPLRVSSQF